MDNNDNKEGLPTDEEVISAFVGEDWENQEETTDVEDANPIKTATVEAYVPDALREPTDHQPGALQDTPPQDEGIAPQATAQDAATAPTVDEKTPEENTTTPPAATETTEEDEAEKATEHEETIATETGPTPPPSRKKSKAPRIIIFTSLLAAVVAIVTTIIVTRPRQEQDAGATKTVNDLTDEQRKQLGIVTKNDREPASTIENKDNYTDEYKQYLELSDEEKSKLEVVPRKENVPDEVLDEITDETDEDVLSNLPEKFDLRDKIDITVGDQGSYGLCWDYATSTSLETYLKLRGIDYNPSEFQMDFLSSTLMYGNRPLHDGGSFQMYMDIASSIGTMSEANFSETGIDPAAYGNEAKDYNYLSLAENQTPVYVTKTVDFPSIRKEKGEVQDKTEEELKEFRDLVKAHIMTNGSLYAVTAGPWGYGLPRYCETSYSGCYANHAMSIIGWDDNYPKENFGGVDEKGNRTTGIPEHDGAYLVLNSWGVDWSGSGAENGVFYISYDEYNIETQLSGVLSTSLDDTSELNSFGSELAEDIIRDKLGFYVIDIDGDEYISDYALRRLTYLDLSSTSLGDAGLRGVAKAFPNISMLNLSDDNLSDITPLRELKSLRSVTLSKNNIEDISPLCQGNEWYSVDISYNKIKDVSCLTEHLSDNASLNLSGNSGVSGYEKFTKLAYLYADEIELESLESFKELTNLRTISVRDNHLKNLTGLNTKEISYLDLSGNRMTDLTTDSTFIGGGYMGWMSGTLVIQNNDLEDISILDNVTAPSVIASDNNFGDLSGYHNDNIVRLDLSHSRNLSNLGALKSLNNLSLGECGIKSLSELEGLNGVDVIELAGNEITSLRGSEVISSVTQLNLENNKLSSLEGIENLQNLSDLLISQNELTTLDGIASAKNLTMLVAGENKLSDISELADLDQLYYATLNDNNISEVPQFSKAKNLFINFKNNPIKNIKISPAMQSLNLDDCAVENIDYSDAKLLSTVNLAGNPDWSDYAGLITASLRGQASVDAQYPYLNISTDYNFSKEQFDSLVPLPGFTDSANYYISLEKYDSGIQLKKEADGTVDLTKYPEQRGFFMGLLKSSNALEAGVSIDRAATKITLEDPSADSIELNYWTNLNNSRHFYTNKVVVNFASAS